jgi:SAM-dependent methyltransferase
VKGGGSGAAIVLQGNALHLPLPDESVDLIVTSPPYFSLRSYKDAFEHYAGQIGSEETPQAFLEALWAATREMVRVLKPSGSIFVNLGDKYAGSGGHNNNGLGKSGLINSQRYLAGRSGQFRDAPKTYAKGSSGIPTKSLMGLPWRFAIGCIDDLGLILRAEIVLDKKNGLPESVQDRVRRSHEQVFHFVKSPRYFAAVDEVRIPNLRADERWLSSQAPERNDNGHIINQSPLGALPGSVWPYVSEPLKVPAHLGIEHFAAFSSELPRRIILGWSPSGVCVECGEGRRPVVDKRFAPSERRGGDGSINRTRAGRLDPNDGGAAGAERMKVLPVLDTTATITGYACACLEPTAATRPAVVVDVFGGTGTTALVARALGRIAISVDLSHDYCRLAKWRTSQPANKVLTRTWTERQGTML